MDLWRRRENEERRKVKSLWERRGREQACGKAKHLWGSRKDGRSVGKARTWRRRESGESVRNVGRGQVCGEGDGSEGNVMGLRGR